MKHFSKSLWTWLIVYAMKVMHILFIFWIYPHQSVLYRTRNSVICLALIWMYSCGNKRLCLQHTHTHSSSTYSTKTCLHTAQLRKQNVRFLWKRLHKIETDEEVLKGKKVQLTSGQSYAAQSCTSLLAQ